MALSDFESVGRVRRQCPSPLSGLGWFTVLTVIAVTLGTVLALAAVGPEVTPLPRGTIRPI
jgi:hypothetical protein